MRERGSLADTTEAEPNTHRVQWSLGGLERNPFQGSRPVHCGVPQGGRSVPCALNCKPRTSFAHALLVSYGTPIAMLQQTTAVYIRRLLALIIIASPIL